MRAWVPPDNSLARKTGLRPVAVQLKVRSTAVEITS